VRERGHGGGASTPLTQADRLARERQVAEERLAARKADYEAIAQASMTAGRDDEHDPDGSTPALEHALAFGLLASAQAQMAEVELAMERLSAGTYGRCRRCAGPIAPERLDVLPSALTCVQCPGP